MCDIVPLEATWDLNGKAISAVLYDHSIQWDSQEGSSKSLYLSYNFDVSVFED